MKRDKIAKLFSEAIKKSRLTLLGETPEAVNEANETADLVIELEAETLRLLKNELTGNLVFSELAKFLRDQKLSEGWAGEVFARVSTHIRLQFGDTSRFLPEIRRVGIGYFKENLEVELAISTYEAIEDDELPGILRQIENRIKAMDTHGIREFDVDCERFRLAALEKIRDELKNEYDQRVEIARQKTQLKMEATPKETSDEQANEILIKPKDRGLNRERAFLFFEYFFTNADVNCTNVDKAKVIERLTGYNHKKITPLFSWVEKKKFETKEKNELSEKFYKDLCYARKLFEMLGLTNIVDSIDEDLGN